MHRVVDFNSHVKWTSQRPSDARKGGREAQWTVASSSEQRWNASQTGGTQPNTIICVPLPCPVAMRSFSQWNARGTKRKTKKVVGKIKRNRHPSPSNNNKDNEHNTTQHFTPLRMNCMSLSQLSWTLPRAHSVWLAEQRSNQWAFFAAEQFTNPLWSPMCWNASTEYLTRVSVISNNSSALRCLMWPTALSGTLCTIQPSAVGWILHRKHTVCHCLDARRNTCLICFGGSSNCCFLYTHYLTVFPLFTLQN